MWRLRDVIDVDFLTGRHERGFAKEFQQRFSNV